MNEIVNKILLAKDKFMPEMNLRKPKFMCNAYRPFTKNKERIQKFTETGDSKYIYQSQLDKACFQYDMVYVNFKDLPRTTASDKVLRDKAFNIVKTQKYDGYQHVFASIVHNLFDKKSVATHKETVINSGVI